MNFTALDFETANFNHNSICQVGIVRVENNLIVEKYMSLVKPPNNHYEWQTINVHKIYPEHTELAPTFNEVWPKIARFIENELVVCHNKSFDIIKLEATLNFYNLSIPTFSVDCTMQIFGGGLEKCCQENGIEFINHHDALADAEACARLYLFSQGVKQSDVLSNSPFVNKLIEKTDLRPDFNNCDQCSPLFKKKVVFTGDLDSMNRKEAAHLAKENGADVNTSISKFTDMVIVGRNPGPTKLDKIQKLGIPIISEDEFLAMLGEQ